MEKIDVIFSNNIGIEIFVLLFSQTNMRELLEKKLVSRNFSQCIDVTLSSPRFISLMRKMNRFPNRVGAIDIDFEMKYVPFRIKLLNERVNTNTAFKRMEIAHHNSSFLVAIVHSYYVYVYSTRQCKLKKLLSAVKDGEEFKTTSLVDNIFAMSGLQKITTYILGLDSVEKLQDISDWNLKKGETLEFSSFSVGDYLVIKHLVNNKSISYYFVSKKLVYQSKETIDWKKSAAYHVNTRDEEIAFGDSFFWFVYRVATQDSLIIGTFKKVDFSSGVPIEKDAGITPSEIKEQGGFASIVKYWDEYYAELETSGPRFNRRSFWNISNSCRAHSDFFGFGYKQIGKWVVSYTISFERIYFYKNGWRERNERLEITDDLALKKNLNLYRIIESLVLLEKRDPFLFEIATRDDVFFHFFGKENTPKWIENLISFVYSENTTLHGIARWNDDSKCIEMNGFTLEKD